MFEFLGENRNLSCYMWRILLFLAYPEICMEREISKVVNLWKQIALFSTFYSIVAYKQYIVDKTQRMPEKWKPMIVFLKMQHAKIMANWNKIEYKCLNTLFVGTIHLVITVWKRYSKPIFQRMCFVIAGFCELWCHLSIQEKTWTMKAIRFLATFASRIQIDSTKCE